MDEHKLKVSTEKGKIWLDGTDITGEIYSCNIEMLSNKAAKVTLAFRAGVDLDVNCQSLQGKEART